MVMGGDLCSEGCGFESRHVLWLEFFHIYLLQKCVQSLFENIEFPNWFSKRNVVTAAAALKLKFGPEKFISPEKRKKSKFSFCENFY